MNAVSYFLCFAAIFRKIAQSLVNFSFPYIYIFCFNFQIYYYFYLNLFRTSMANLRTHQVHYMFKPGNFTTQCLRQKYLSHRLVGEVSWFQVVCIVFILFFKSISKKRSLMMDLNETLQEEHFFNFDWFPNPSNISFIQKTCHKNNLPAQTRW